MTGFILYECISQSSPITHCSSQTLHCIHRRLVQQSLSLMLCQCLCLSVTNKRKEKHLCLLYPSSSSFLSSQDRESGWCQFTGSSSNWQWHTHFTPWGEIECANVIQPPPRSDLALVILPITRVTPPPLEWNFPCFPGTHDKLPL